MIDFTCHWSVFTSSDMIDFTSALECFYIVVPVDLLIIVGAGDPHADPNGNPARRNAAHEDLRRIGDFQDLALDFGLRPSLRGGSG